MLEIALENTCQITIILNFPIYGKVKLITVTQDVSMKSSYTQSGLLGKTFFVYLKLVILNTMFLKIVMILLICFMIFEDQSLV